MSKVRYPILCVDDEVNILSSLTRILRQNFKVTTCSSGQEALELLEKGEIKFYVIVSDMRMPQMDGATFLAHAREIVPDTTRVLLTGYADVKSAIAAVNQGQIFRFLTKPCPAPDLNQALLDGVRQYSLVTAERILLEKTLKGSIQMLTDILSMAQPMAFGRAERIKQDVMVLAEKLDLVNAWEVEVAALLSQVGSITLPSDVLTKLYIGGALTDSEEELVSGLPAIGVKLLEHIPRIDGIKNILRHQNEPFEAKLSKLPTKLRDQVSRGSFLLRAVIDLELLQAHDMTLETAMATLRGRPGIYDPQVLDLLEQIKRASAAERSINAVGVMSIEEGMVLAEDVRNSEGVLLISRGHSVTIGSIQRLKSFHNRMSIEEPLYVFREEEKGSCEETPPEEGSVSPDGSGEGEPVEETVPSQ